MIKENVKCLFDDLVDLKKLKPRKGNRNKHDKEQILRLAKIIQAHGQRKPIIVAKNDGFMVTGHATLEALKHLGWQKCAVNFQEFKDDTEIWAHHIADNAIASWAVLDFQGINMDLPDFGPDFDLDLLGIKDFTLDVTEKLPPGDEEETPEPPKEPKSKLGDLWILGNHRLLCGDSTNIQHVDRLMDGQKADMVFTDPPYGIGFNYNSHKDTTGDEYKDFCRDWFHCLKLQSDFIVISTGWAYNLFWYQQEPKDTFYWICKNKRTGGSISHFRKVEPIFIWGKPQNKYDFDFWEQTTQIEEDLKGQHTCPKPVSLIEQIIQGCQEKGKILDVFGGSGTTLIACEKTKRKCFMMELDPKYIDVILSRWAKYTGKDPIRDDGAKWSDINKP
jgi:DNA modification methylase